MLVSRGARRRTRPAPDALLAEPPAHPARETEALPNAASRIKPAIAIKLFDRLERGLADNRAVKRMRAERGRLFRSINAARVAARPAGL